ncbi:nucleotide sugar dehydrogenase family protein [Clostridium baratii str. Sullivan]|uniref:Nucleotide sugar dehydrogenase family protein n=1 Tax=Clostridium baratii str. Sullivan TaxID=1415775 RepID=A0A0A7FVZ2_9CLOT|nr:nucleotide sugar dehydrogenase [Clostridium baratii]AIY83779.1 nucleotide sugar dehydrogenase family protein [Clostridium baratii str. Sullivan]
MGIYKNIINKIDTISVVGLGYVGMPLAIAFAKKVNVIGYDLNKEKIESYINGIDVTNEVGNAEIKETKAKFTTDENELKKCRFHIVAVPTPINGDKTPNLEPVISASKTIGRNLTKGSIVVYESTVYPGVTEEVCVPILEKESGLKYGSDFKVGYSPERINPGDKVNKLETIVKIVSGMDNESLNEIANIYEIIIDAGVHRAESIKVAEAAKVIENSQRDINIAFMNELSIIFNEMGIDTKAVLEAAGTKWNFMKFNPGLVGGHCIGVDPYYLTYKAEQEGYHSQIILAGRRVNDDMGKYVAGSIVKKLIEANIQIKGARVGVLGFTFKENCPDTRNSKVIDIINELEQYGIQTFITDPLADRNEIENEYGLQLLDFNQLENLDAVVVAVPHDEYKSLTMNEIDKLYSINNELYNEIAATSSIEESTKKVLIDIKGIFDKENSQKLGYIYWRL